MAGGGLGVIGRGVPDDDHLLPGLGSPVQCHRLHDAGVGRGARITGSAGMTGVAALKGQGVQPALDGGRVGGEVHIGARRFAAGTVGGTTPVRDQREAVRGRGRRGLIRDRAHTRAHGGHIIGHGVRGIHHEDQIETRIRGCGRLGIAGHADLLLNQLGDLLVTDLVGVVEHIGIEAETRRCFAVIPPDALGLHEFVDPSVIVPSSGRGIGLVPGESGRRGIDVGDLQGAGMHRIPLIDQCRLSLLRLIAQTPHPSPGII